MALYKNLLNEFQQPIGGLVGRLQQPLPQAKRGLLGDPDFASSLTRLGANLMAAGAQTDNTLGALGTALGATIDQNQAARLQEAQIGAYQAKNAQEAGPATPFGGTGYQNQIMSSRYQFHLANGDAPLVAEQKAINDFYSLNPVTGVDAEGRPYTMPRAALPSMPSSMGQPVAPAMQNAAPDPIDQAAQAMGIAPAPTGTLLPPPSGSGTPDMGMFTQGATSTATLAPPSIQVPQIEGAGPNTQQALRQKAGEAQIDIEKTQAIGSAKTTAEKRSEFNTQLAQLPMLLDVTQKLNKLADQASFTIGQKATDFVSTNILGLPTKGDTARTEYISTVRNVVLPLLRSTFGAQFTAAEGEKLLETLGSPDATPEAKKATLNAFVEQKIRNLEASAKDAGVELPPISQLATSVAKPKSKDDFDALPKGTPFVLPDGRTGVK